MSTWIQPPELSVPPSLLQAAGGQALLAQILLQRGICTPETARAFLDPDAYTLALPTELPGMQEAADRLEKAIREQEPVCIWGDFDVDGQTATTLLVSTLKDLGANVTFHIPVRETESHGVQLQALQNVINQGTRLVLTCDTGISANESIAYAKQRGVDTIITDHHSLPETLPPALAIVTPRLLPAAHPFSGLPGAGVAYQLACELCRRAGLPEKAEDQLDLLALAIVADLALQTRDTRCLLQRGLQALRSTRRLGLQVLMELVELSPAWLTEEHISFVLGPRLNALGRLADANRAVEFFLTNDLSRARILAVELEGLNARRKLLTDQVYQGTLAQIDRDPSLLDSAALVLAHPSWPGGVIGIVASRLVERYNRPVVLFSAPAGEIARGSARSVEGCDISVAIAAQSVLLESFGGHPMAAGLSIQPERIPEFRSALDQTVKSMLGEARAEPVLTIDASLSLSELSFELAEQLERLAPFGPGNPALTLYTPNLTLLNSTPVGRNEEHLQLIVEDESSQTAKAIWWQAATRDPSGLGLPRGRFDLAYHVRTSNYRGQREIQVEWVEARPLEAPIELEEVIKPSIQVVDYRSQSHPIVLLRQLLEKEDVQVWAEGEAAALLCKPAPGQIAIRTRNRFQLSPAPSLVIWTPPPGGRELQAGLKRVFAETIGPQTLYLFAVDPAIGSIEDFLKRLAGLVKYVLKSMGGKVKCSTLAAATAQREPVVRKGLSWLECRGFTRILEDEGDEVLLGLGDQPPGKNTETIEAQIKAYLEEAAAFREYYREAEGESLVRMESLP